MPKSRNNKKLGGDVVNPDRLNTEPVPAVCASAANSSTDTDADNLQAQAQTLAQKQKRKRQPRGSSKGSNKSELKSSLSNRSFNLENMSETQYPGWDGAKDEPHEIKQLQITSPYTKWRVTQQYIVDPPYREQLRLRRNLNSQSTAAATARGDYLSLTGREQLVIAHAIKNLSEIFEPKLTAETLKEFGLAKLEPTYVGNLAKPLPDIIIEPTSMGATVLAYLLENYTLGLANLIVPNCSSCSSEEELEPNSSISDREYDAAIRSIVATVKIRRKVRCGTFPGPLLKPNPFVKMVYECIAQKEVEDSGKTKAKERGELKDG